MEICSPFDEPMLWHELDSGCLFYMLPHGSRSTVLAMKVEHIGPRGSQLGCLLFDPTIKLRFELDNKLVVPLPKATLVPGPLGDFPSEYPKHGELVQTLGGPNLILIADPGIGVSEELRRAVEMRTGKVNKAPSYPEEMLMPCQGWKIVLPAPTESSKWKTIYEWPPRQA